MTDQPSNNDQKNIDPKELDSQEKTPEELAWEQRLQQRFEELRKRDPFIYR
jgi:hypothetical protein